MLRENKAGMKRKKKSSKIDFSKMDSLGHNPFAQLGAKFQLEPSQNSSELEAPQAEEPPKKPQLMIRREKRKGNKWVTAIYHLGADAKTVLKPLKKRFASGGGLDGDCLVIQGDHLAEIIAWFQGQGYPVRRGS